MPDAKTTLPEAVLTIGEGVFYEDYDYASGPGLRILRDTQTAITEFCERVERGEIRSKRTYAKFCELLGRAPR
jgi:hypothetical protein